MVIKQKREDVKIFPRFWLHRLPDIGKRQRVPDPGDKFYVGVSLLPVGNQELHHSLAPAI